MFTKYGEARPLAAGRSISLQSVQNSSGNLSSPPEVQERLAWFRARDLDFRWPRELTRAEEWRDLAGESDPGLFDAALYRWAQSLESKGRVDLAALLYDAVAAFSQKSEYGLRANRQVSSMKGNAGFGLRAENFFRQFSSQALDLTTLAGFVMGGLAYRMGRTWALSRLSYASESLLPSLWRRTLASSIGFAVEVPAFVFGGRGASAALGKPSVDHEGLGRQLVSTALFLGPLKLISAGAPPLASRMGPDQVVATQMLSGISTYLGFYVGHRLEQSLGLKPSQSPGSTAMDALISLLHARIASGLIEASSGRRWNAWNLAWEARESLASRAKFPDSFGGALAWSFPMYSEAATALAGPMGLPGRSSAETRSKLEGVSWMSGYREVGAPRRVVNFETGALAWGGEGALQWLMELRRYHEGPSGAGRRGDLELWWIPESPVDTVLLNDFGMSYSRDSGRLEQVNSASRTAIRAYWPALRKSEAFVHVADLSSGVGKILNKWMEREEAGLQGLINEQWLELQFEALCRKKLGFVEKVREGEKDFLIFEKGKRQLLPPNLVLFAETQDPRQRDTKVAPRYFQNQYWSRSPAEAAATFGEGLGEALPPGTVISHFLDPRALILPNWAGPRGMGQGTRFFFLQGLRYWMAEAAGAQLRDVTTVEPKARLDLLRDIAFPKSPAAKSGSEPLALPELPTATEAKPAEGVATTRYPVENYPQQVFGAETVPYPDIFPTTIAPERVQAIRTRPQDAPSAILETGPTKKILEVESEPTTPIPGPRSKEQPRIFPLPAPEQSAKTVGASVPVFQKDRIGLDPTLELTLEQNRQMQGEKPLPFDDTALMSSQQMAEARRSSASAETRGGLLLRSLGRPMLRAWNRAACLWGQLRLGFYGLIGRRPPEALLQKVRSYRELLKK